MFDLVIFVKSVTLKLIHDLFVVSIVPIVTFELVVVPHAFVYLVFYI